MGMALGRDNGDYFGVTYSLWAGILELAEQWGWGPVGTDPPRGMDRGAWGGSYYSSDQQTCRDEDARELAGALRRLLRGEPPAVARPSGDPEREALRGFVDAASRNTGSPLCHPTAEAANWLTTPEGRVFLVKFVHFCQGGAFELG